MKSRTTIIMLFLSSILLYACSGDNDKETKAGKIDTMTKEIGQKAVRMIKTPIEKAQAVADEETKRAQEMDDRGNQ
jgi:hypothetical protein